jgi:hypothetical protein
MKPCVPSWSVWAFTTNTNRSSKVLAVYSDKVRAGVTAEMAKELAFKSLG